MGDILMYKIYKVAAAVVVLSGCVVIHLSSSEVD